MGYNRSVTVVITTYNHAHFLAEAIDSVIGQTHPADEIIVVDDGSSDDPGTVVASRPEVQFIRQLNQGLASARNTGLWAASSEAIVFLDADDRLLPNALEQGLACLVREPRSGLVYGGHRRTDAEWRPIGEDRYDPLGDPYTDLLQGKPIGMHAAVMYSRDRLREIGGFDTSLQRCEDYDVYLRMAQTHPIASHPNTVAEYRIHGANISLDNRDMLRWILKVHERQKSFALARPDAAKAWHFGRSFWRDYYSEQTLVSAKQAWMQSSHKLRAVRGLLNSMLMSPRPAARMAMRAARMAMRAAAKSIIKKYRTLRLRTGVYHVYGKSRLNYSQDELVVICVVRNGRIYVNSFIKHYFALGVKHIVFLDNGSTDDTIQIVSRYDNVTVLKTHLPYSKYENLMKNYLARRFSKGRWNLCADIDEFFDWPFSRTVSIGSLLRYLNARGYTAVVAQMLDLFSDLPLAEVRDDPEEDVTKKYKYYDISNISKVTYIYSRLSYDDIKMHLGGIRKTIFGTKTLGLTKAALVFVGPRIQLFKVWHHAENAYLANFTCVLLHYPFTSSFYDKVKDAAATKRYGPVTSDEYDLYWARLSREPRLTLHLDTARRYIGVEPLIDEGFLVASSDYLDWVGAQRNGQVS
jgi:glycosyltransferase involved in cell wall biosynthesis